MRQRVQQLTEPGVMQIVAVTDPMQLGFYRQAMIGIRVTGDIARDRRQARRRCPPSTTSCSPPARSTSSPRSSARTTTTSSSCSTPRSARLAGVAVHRDVRLPETPQAVLQLGNAIDAIPSKGRHHDRHRPAVRERAARRRGRRTAAKAQRITSGCTSPGSSVLEDGTASRSSCAARATTSGTTAASGTSTASPACSS